MAWIKTFERDNNLPQMRLLENVLAATSPDRDLLDAYYTILKQLEEHGVVSSDEASLLRIELYAKNELMELTAGNKGRLTTETVVTIKEKLINRMKESSYNEGRAAGFSEATSNHEKLINDERTRMCQRVEAEIKKEFGPKYNNAEKMAVFYSWAVSILFILGTVALAIIVNPSPWIIVLAIVVAIVPTAQAVSTLVRKNNWLRKKMRKKVAEKEAEETDRRKEEGMKILSAVEKSKE